MLLLFYLSSNSAMPQNLCPYMSVVHAYTVMPSTLFYLNIVCQIIINNDMYIGFGGFRRTVLVSFFVGLFFSHQP